MNAPIKTYGPRWHSVRHLYIGASEIATICGLNPWATVEDVAESKHHPEGRVQPDSSPNSPIWWGHQDEPGIVEAAKHLLRPSAQTWEVRTGLSWTDDEHGLMASPDAIFLNGGKERINITDGPTELVEAKSVNKSAPSWRNGPPAHVQLQGHTQIALMGPYCKRVHIAARISGRPVQIWTFERKDGLVTAIKNIAKTWWESYQLMGTNAWSSYTASALTDAGFAHADPVRRNNDVVSSANLDLINSWREARKQAREWKEKQMQLSGEISELLGDADTLADPDGNPLIRRSWVHRNGVDIKTLCAEHPDLEEQYSYPMSHQRLTEVQKRSTEGK